MPALAAAIAERLAKSTQEAATRPVVGWKKVREYEVDPKTGAPKGPVYERVEKGAQAGGAAVLAAVVTVGAIVLVAGQRAARTGTARLETQYEAKVTAPAKNETYEGGIAHGATRTVWADRPDYLSPVVGETTKNTGRTRRRPKIQTRDDVAPYNPAVGRLI
jgi:hypothetical protein